MDEEEWEDKNPANSSAHNPANRSANSIQHYFMFLHSGEQYFLIFHLPSCSPYRVCEASFVASSGLLQDPVTFHYGTARAGRLTSGVLSPSVRTASLNAGKEMKYQPALTKDIRLNNLLNDQNPHDMTHTLLVVRR